MVQTKNEQKFNNNNMKGKLLEDTFEQLVELGHSTAKKTVKSVAQTLNPFDKMLDSSEIKNKEKNHTPLDFNKLQDKFKDKEKIAAEALRNRLFQMVRQGDEKIVMENRQKELEKKRREEWEKQEKKRKEKEKQEKQTNDIPLGKIRKTIFSPKKTAKRQHTETKPSIGKQ